MVQLPNGRSLWRPGSRAKAAARILLLLAAAAVIAALASTYGIAYDYGYLRASLLAGTPGGNYHALATRLAARAERQHGTLTVLPTAGSVENIGRLARTGEGCSEQFAFVQDGTPVPPDARLEVLGRLPEPESLLLLGRRDRVFAGFSDLRGASIGIGPEGSGTGYLIRHLFEDPDLRGLGVRLSNHDLREQAALVAQGRLDLAAVVMYEHAALLRSLIQEFDLDIVSPSNAEGLLARHSWLGQGRISAGRFDVVRPTPPVDRIVARVDTLVLAGPCTRRAERVVLLMLLAAELPGFTRANPPKATGSVTALPLAPEARQFFLTGEPELADRYFPWLVNLMAPAYWVYLVMAVTLLFNAMSGYSRFRLWRIDATREKLERSLEELTGPGLTHAEMRAISEAPVLDRPEARGAARELIRRFADLRARCQRQVGSIFTPMGDEIYYRYQEALIADATATLAALLRGASDPPKT
jgi:TRAP-type uncharacterized transport system substrate-binding protein